MECTNRTIGSHELTDEMNNIIDAIIAGENVKGFAFAGGGKSSLLRASEKYHIGKLGLYICYNKSLEQEARTLFKGNNVHIATSHAFALNAFDKETKSRFMEKVNLKQTRSTVAKYSGLGVEHEYYSLLELDKNWRIFPAIVENYISTASIKLSRIHLTEKANNLVNQLVKKRKIKSAERESVFDYLVDRSNDLAKSMLDVKIDCPATHDTYVKFWQLSGPIIEYDYIMFDEAQDANPVLLSVILNQSCQKIFVGDKFQSIYQFRGGVNAMDIIPFEAFPLSKSFRYGKSIGELATKILNHSDDEVKISGVGYDTQIFKGSDYNGTDSFLYVAHTNIELLEMLIRCFNHKVPTVFTSNKAGYVLSKIDNMINIFNGVKPTHPKYKRYNNFPELLLGERDLESQTIGKWIEEDLDKVKTLQDALQWSLDIPTKNAQIFLSTAHMSKGLEFDVVMLADDYHKIIDSFNSGKALDETELNLLYVAITRTKKILVIPDELHAALDKNLAFTLNKHKPAKCMLDNLLPETKNEPAKSAKPIQAETVVKVNSEPQPITESHESSSLVSSPKKAPNKKSTTKPDATQEVPTKPIKKAIPTNCGVKGLKGINIEVGRSKANDTPQYWSPTNTNEYLNPNIAIIGTMGTGKTQTVKSMLTQLNRQISLNTNGETMGTLIFDYKSDYKDAEFIGETGALALEPHNLPINPLALFSFNRLSVMNTAKVFISTISKSFRLGPKQELTLKNCILEAYERKGFDKEDLSTYRNQPPTIRDVVAIYSAQSNVKPDSLTTALSDLHDYEIFEPNARKCKSLYEMLEEQTVVISLGGIDSQLQNLIVALLLDQFYVQMQTSSKPVPDGQYRALKRMILVDECDNFLSQDFPSLRKILKEGREFGVGCLLSTQGLDHFQTSENSYSDYMVAWCVHRLNNPKAKPIESLFNISGKPELDSRMHELRELEKHHSLFVDGRKRVTYQESTAFWKLMTKNDKSETTTS